VIGHDAALLLAAGAVLEDLEPAERDAYDAHRAGCDACAVAEDELGLVLADLALVVPERLPPPELLAGIRLAIDAEDRLPSVRAGSPGLTSAASLPPAAVPAPPPIARLTPRPSRGPFVAALGLAAVVGIVAVGLGIRGVGLQAEADRSAALVEQLRGELAGRGAAVAAVLDPAHVAVALHPEALAPAAAASVVFVPGTDKAWIVAEGLPATTPGTGYQLWYADAAGVHGLQTVAFDGSGTFVAPLGVDLAAGDAVMVTLEDAGGATGQPGPQVVFGEL
jgi:hypothetical protein